MMPFDELRLGKYVKLAVPAGRRNQVTQRPGAYRAEYKVTELGADFVRLMDCAGGGYPPHGFKLTKAHYIEVWEPLLTGHRRTDHV